MHFGLVQEFALSTNASYLLISGNGLVILQLHTEKEHT